MMSKLFIAVFTVVTITFFSCGGGKGKDGTSSQGGVYNYSNPGLVHDQKAIDEAFASLRNMDKFKGKKIKVFQNFQIQDYEIAMDISDPSKPANIDHYEFTDGKWKTPEPVQISGGSADMEDNLSDLDKIAVNKVADMVKIVDEKAKAIEGAKPCAYIGFNLFVPNQIREFSSNIKGTRENVSVTFNADGTLKK